MIFNTIFNLILRIIASLIPHKIHTDTFSNRSHDSEFYYDVSCATEKVVSLGLFLSNVYLIYLFVTNILPKAYPYDTVHGLIKQSSPIHIEVSYVDPQTNQSLTKQFPTVEITPHEVNTFVTLYINQNDRSDVKLIRPLNSKEKIGYSILIWLAVLLFTYGFYYMWISKKECKDFTLYHVLVMLIGSR